MEAVEAAKIRQQKIIAEGETDKAAERVLQEQEQIKILIAIETKVKEEESNRQLAEIAFVTAELKAKTVKVQADAQYYQNKKLVSAGLTPQERAYWNYRSDSVTAVSIAKIKFPETMFIGESGKGGSPIEALIGANMAKQLQRSNTK